MDTHTHNQKHAWAQMDTRTNERTHLDGLTHPPGEVLQHRYQQWAVHISWLHQQSSQIAREGGAPENCTRGVHDAVRQGQQPWRPAHRMRMEEVPLFAPDISEGCTLETCTLEGADSSAVREGTGGRLMLRTICRCVKKLLDPCRGYKGDLVSERSSFLPLSLHCAHVAHTQSTYTHKPHLSRTYTLACTF